MFYDELRETIYGDNNHVYSIDLWREYRNDSNYSLATHLIILRPKNRIQEER